MPQFRFSIYFNSIKFCLLYQARVFIVIYYYSSSLCHTCVLQHTSSSPFFWYFIVLLLVFNRLTHSYSNFLFHLKMKCLYHQVLKWTLKLVDKQMVRKVIMWIVTLKSNRNIKFKKKNIHLACHLSWVYQMTSEYKKKCLETKQRNWREGKNWKNEEKNNSKIEIASRQFMYEKCESNDNQM